MPDDQLFADEAKPATAAVLLSGDSSSLQSGAVRGIANLVASSVQDLKTDNVTITDGTGQLLWPAGDGTAGGDPDGGVGPGSGADGEVGAG
jgi:flagellar M-ring protein FliF